MNGEGNGRKDSGYESTGRCSLHWPPHWRCALVIVLTGCEGSGSKVAASANNSSNPELFTIPPEQMSHVQVLKVQPTTLTRTLRLTGAVAYNGFRTTPVITQVSGPVSRVVVVPGQKVQQGEPMLYVASPDYSQLRTNYSESQGRLRSGAKGLCARQGLVRA